MRELTLEERKKYDRMVRNSKQMSIHDIINIEAAPHSSKSLDLIDDENDSKIIYTQMELFK